MDIFLSITSVLLFFLTCFLAFRMAEQTAAMGTLEKEISETSHKNKKLQKQLQGRGDKLSKKSQEASKKQAKVKGQRQRIDQQQNHLNEARSNFEDAKTKVTELSKEVSRLRVDREQLRQKLHQKDATRGETQEKAHAKAEVPATETPDETIQEPKSPRESRSLTLAQLGRELEKAEENEGRLLRRVGQLKQAVVEREAKLRQVTRKCEHNHRAYIITQLQLDLLSDEIYVFRHGKQPPLRHADKAAKRQLDVKIDEPITLLNEDGPIDLIGVGDRADEPFDPIEEEIFEEEFLDEAAEEEVEADIAPAVEEEVDDEAVELAARAEEAKREAELKAAEEAAKEEAEKEAAEAKKKKTTRLRKGGRAKAQASAPPRPEA